jgi:hypothetical protein
MNLKSTITFTLRQTNFDDDFTNNVRLLYFETQKTRLENPKPFKIRLDHSSSLGNDFVTKNVDLQISIFQFFDISMFFFLQWS